MPFRGSTGTTRSTPANGASRFASNCYGPDWFGGLGIIDRYALDGRFFLVYLDIDDRSGIRVDKFVIEDASP